MNGARSRVRIDFVPFLFDFLPLLPGFLSVGSCSLQSFCSKTHIDLLLCFVAATDGLVEKTAGVAFVKDLHDFFAACGVDIRLARATGNLNRNGINNDSPLLFFVCRCGCILKRTLGWLVVLRTAVESGRSIPYICRTNDGGSPAKPFQPPAIHRPLSRKTSPHARQQNARDPNS
jgi:hypothetical protein